MRCVTNNEKITYTTLMLLVLSCSSIMADDRIITLEEVIAMARTRCVDAAVALNELKPTYNKTGTGDSWYRHCRH